jgi:hypothetical protein
MYPPNIANAANIIHIMLPLVPVFGTTGITVLVTSDSHQSEAEFFILFTAAEGDLFHSILNLISSQPSHGIIRIF